VEIHAAAMSALVFLAALATLPAHCAPVPVTVAKDMPRAFNSKLLGQASANLASAYSKACAEGLVRKKKLAPSGRIILHNAPDANVASIYDSGARTLLEYWFVTHDGKTHIPSVDELHEAIFCAMHGASEKEQEESGRCLPD
jgi:hypothetical protein